MRYVRAGCSECGSEVCEVCAGLPFVFFFCLGFLGFAFESEGDGEDFVISEFGESGIVTVGGVIAFRARLIDEGSKDGSLANWVEYQVL